MDVRERIGEKKCYPLENIIFSFATSCEDTIIISDPLMKIASIYCFQSLWPVNITGHRVFWFEHGSVSKSKICIPKYQRACSQKRKRPLYHPIQFFSQCFH